MSNKIHVNDIGVALQVQVWNCNLNAAVDLTNATSKHIVLGKPDGTESSFAADIVHAGSGLIQYVTVSGDLDAIGIWSIQGIIDINSGTFHTDMKKFSVYRNI